MTTPIFKDPPLPVALSYEELLGDNADLYQCAVHNQRRIQKLQELNKQMSTVLQEVLETNLPDLRQTVSLTVMQEHQKLQHQLDLIDAKIKTVLIE